MAARLFKGRSAWLAASVAAIVLSVAGYLLYWDRLPLYEVAETGLEQTDVDRAQHSFDERGVPILKIADVGEQRHPAWIAIYALAYAGEETYDEKLKGLKNIDKFRACIDWLSINLKQKKNDLWVWEYGFDNTYNDINIKAPWSSAFAQAVGIQAMLASFRLDGEPEHLELAKNAAKSLFTPLGQGGFLFQRNQDVWFEEIPEPQSNPSHILNGHMRVLLALRDLFDATGERHYHDWFQRGLQTLERWLPLFDSGYWLRYDLNPKKIELLFRFVNPYGFVGRPVAIDKIFLRDPLSNKENILDIGTQEDEAGLQRIAGVDWGIRETLEGRNIRRIIPSEIDYDKGTPHSYFYLSLPGEWTDNLRKNCYELTITYYDDTPANYAVQMRSIAPGSEYIELKDGSLHFSGSRQWRNWTIPLRITDLGYWVGKSYAEKHFVYLNLLAEKNVWLFHWAEKAKGYFNFIAMPFQRFQLVDVNLPDLPTQTPMRPKFELSPNGVIKQFIDGISRYHPYIIADQLLTSGKAIPPNAEIDFDLKNIQREAALKWFLDEKNQKRIKDSVTFQFDFKNVYNDIVTDPPWASAFSQAYILKSLVYGMATYKNYLTELEMLTRKVINSFRVEFSEGGVTSFSREGLPFFEEVPNETHVLNAHLVTINELKNAGKYFKDSTIQSLSEQGTENLKNQLNSFDTGYWLRYDQNPKKEILFQIDWINAEQSPLIESIHLVNPVNETSTSVSIVSDSSQGRPIEISGIDWHQEQLSDERLVRAFQNGYALRNEAIEGSAQHNVFFRIKIPNQKIRDFFNISPHRLIIRYKDVAPGIFAIKVQSIWDGNSLSFIPLRGHLWKTNGDNNWKEIYFTVRSQDMGWYKGADYQKYEVEQLEKISDTTKDWFFDQYAERHRYFLDLKLSGKPFVYESRPNLISHHIPAPKIIGSSPTYPDYGFENALDDNAINDYVAGIENQNEFYVLLDFGQMVEIRKIQLEWENKNNYANKIEIISIDEDGTPLSEISKISVKAKDGQTIFELPKDKISRFIKIIFSEFEGQPRLLLRLIKFSGKHER